MKRNILLIFFAALSASCTFPARPPSEIITKFDKVEHDRYMQSGSGTIVGQGFLRQRGGGVVTCAGNPVLLVPSTYFFREIIGNLREGHQVVVSQNIDSSYRSIMKKSQCDAQGNFKFTNLAAEAWIVITSVKWVVGQSEQGGTITREVTVVNDQPSQVLLTE